MIMPSPFGWSINQLADLAWFILGQLGEVHADTFKTQTRAMSASSGNLTVTRRPACFAQSMNRLQSCVTCL